MIQKKVFLGGMNSDFSEEKLPEGQDRYRLNCRVLSNQDSNIGNITSVNGNTLVSFTLPIGNNTVIGSKEDPLQKKIYYFVYNSSLKHSILEYDTVANTVAKVFQDGVAGNAANILNFDKDHLITGINIVILTATTHLLYWTDNFNDPRKINIEKGKFYMLGNYTDGYKHPFEARYITRIKQPPLKCPTYVWENIASTLQVEASQSVIQTIASGATDLAAIDTDIYDPENAFNNATAYSWVIPPTAPATAIYNIKTTVYLEHPGIAFNRAEIYIKKNGVIIGTKLVPPNIFPGQNYDLLVSNVTGVIGDTFNVYIKNVSLTGAEFISSKVILFESLLVNTATQEINHLFKKLFQFKVQFVYDDYEVSSWSPISKFVLPETIADPLANDDIVTQDNKIIITVPTGSGIVKKIRIAAKEVNSSDFSLVAELDKSILQITDNSTYDYTFLNEGNYFPLEINESIKLFDNVPLLSQSQDYIFTNRLTDGLITEGFDAVSIDMKLPISYTDVTASSVNTHFPKKSYLKSGSIYNVGVVYYENYGNRSGVTNVVNGKTTELQPNGTLGTKLYIPFLTDLNYAPGAGTSLMNKVPVVKSEIYNRPPVWATHYQVLRSKNQAITKYIQFAAESVTYASPNVEIGIKNMYVNYKSSYPQSILVYDFTKGDRIRFIAPQATNTTIGAPFSFNNSEIVSFDLGTGILKIKDNFSVPVGMVAGVLFEIYTPLEPTINDNEIMYEVCEEGDITTDSNGDLVHTGDFNQAFYNSTSSVYDNPAPGSILLNVSAASATAILAAQVARGGSISAKVEGNGWSVHGSLSYFTPTTVSIVYSTEGITGTWNAGASVIILSASIEFTSGDCFRRVQENINANLDINIESMNVSNMFLSQAWDYGRPNRIDSNFKRITRPSTIIYSEQLVPETFINGLSSVYDTSFQTYENKYGGIYKLYAKDQTLIMFQELKIAPIPVAQNIFSGTQGGTVVGTSTQVLSPSVQYYVGEFGIGKNPESFAVYGNSIYFMDLYRCTPIRLSRDGLTPLAEEGNMNDYFIKKCSTILGLNQQVKVYGVYDLEFGEYILSFEGVVGSSGSTIAFDEGNNSWNTYYSYLPENMCSNSGGLVSFKNGAIWTHNSNAIQNNFYGIQYASELWVVLNDQPENEKIFTAIEETCKDVWEVPFITNVNGQESNLIASDFQQKEQQQQYAAVWKDINTPNIIPGTGLFTGDPMRSRTFLIKLKYSGTTPTKLYSLNLRYIISNLHNR